jgi:adenosylmethionine-8-amino-7-oxononanoate aminotransferase
VAPVAEPAEDTEADDDAPAEADAEDVAEHGVLVRNTGDTIALSPPLIIEKQHIEHIVGTLAGAIARAA